MEIKSRTTRTDSARSEGKRLFAKVLLASGTALAISCGSPDSRTECGSDGGHSAVDSGTDTTDAGGAGGMDAGCTPRTPVCVSQSNTFLLDKGMIAPVGDYRIRLNDTKEVGSEQVAVVGLLDSCNHEQDSREINENASGQFTSGSATIHVGAAMITVTSPQQARLSVDIVCPDSGTGGMDAGSGG
jgi:hypothetical protein